MSEEILEVIRSTIKTEINGKLDDMKNILKQQNEAAHVFRKKMDAHIQRVEPVISSFEETKQFNESVKKYGGRVIWWAKVLGSLGVIAIAIKTFLLKQI